MSICLSPSIFFFRDRHWAFMLDSVFLQISILMGITVSVAFVMRLLRQPLMTAYLIAGIVAGPFFLNLLQGDTQLFDSLAELGVILLLFMVGLSLNVEHIKMIGKIALAVGMTQVTFTAIIGYGILRWLGFAQFSSAYMALAMVFSSTIIIVKLLADKKDGASVYGRYTLGLMVVQDMIALILLLVLTSVNKDAGLSAIMVDLALKLLVLIALVMLLARIVVPRILHHVAASSEFLFIFTVAWVFGVASLVHWLGFSAEIGALIAGVTLGSSVYQAEISSRVKPLRDFFIVLFFIILGSELHLANLQDVVMPGLVLSLFILFGNPFILYRAFRAFHFTRRNSFLAGVIAGQVSEFGFILLFTGKQLGHLQGTELEVFTFVALVTIIISSYIIPYNEQIYRALMPVFQLFGKDKYRQQEEDVEQYDVWVFGYHRIGWKVCEALIAQGVSFAVVDFNPVVLAKLRRRGIRHFYGDAADVEFLETLPLERAKMVISTLPEADDQYTLIRHIRHRTQKTIIIANLYHTEYLTKLYRGGANYVMMPHLLGGNWMAEVLQHKPWTKRTFQELKGDQREEMKLRFTKVRHIEDEE